MTNVRINRCGSCGNLADAHALGCRAVARAERERLQASCSHDPSYGVTRTTGEPLGPPLCGRCRLDLSNVPGFTLSDARPVTARPSRIPFRPARVSLPPGGSLPSDWVINDIRIGNVSMVPPRLTHAALVCYRRRTHGVAVALNAAASVALAFLDQPLAAGFFVVAALLHVFAFARAGKVG